jgi:hypothetical protein
MAAGRILALLAASGQARGVHSVSAVVAAIGLLLASAATAAAVASAPTAVAPTNATKGKPKSKPKPKARPRRSKAHARFTKPLKLSHAPGSRAERYAALSPTACLAELSQRGIAFTREPPTRGVEIPIRVTGKVGGVLYRTDFPDRERSKVPWEIFDCRLVLALDDFGEVLRAHSIVEARIFSCWRPPSKTWPMDEWGKRHEGALAVDLRELKKDDGSALNILDQFHGQLGATLCGADAVPPSPDSPEARELHEIACAAVDSHLFNSVLTPNYNPPHKNHFHLELTPGVDWFLSH